MTQKTPSAKKQLRLHKDTNQLIYPINFTMHNRQLFRWNLPKNFKVIGLDSFTYVASFFLETAYEFKFRARDIIGLASFAILSSARYASKAHEPLANPQLTYPSTSSEECSMFEQNAARN